MTPASGSAFAVDSFEYVDAGSGMGLLRLAGTWTGGLAPEDPRLVALAGGERVSLSALPSPPAEPGDVWRAAFSIAPELVGAAFELEPADGPAIALPAPTQHGVTPAPEPGPAPEPPPVPAPEAPRVERESRRRARLRTALAGERDARLAAERTAAEERARAERAEEALREQLHGTVGKAQELLERIDDYDHTRESFAEEIEALRQSHAELLAAERAEHQAESAALYEDLETVRRELATVRAELTTGNEHLDTAHEAHTLELGAARTQRDAALERQRDLTRQIESARAEVADLGTRLDQRDELLRRARAEAAEAARGNEAVHAAAVRLRDAVAARAGEAAEAGSRRRFERDVDREELRRGAERIERLEAEAERLRDAIHAQLPHPLGPSPLQEVLPLSGEPDQAPAGAETEAAAPDQS